MWPQAINPLHSVALSAAVAVIPILVLFILLLSRKIAGHVATVFTPTVASVTSGNYSVSTVFSGGGCNTVSATSATVTIEPQPTLGSVSIGPALMCTGYPVTLSETGTPTVPGTGSNVYTWSGPAGVVATMSSVTGATSFTFSPTTSS